MPPASKCFIAASSLFLLAGLQAGCLINVGGTKLVGATAERMSVDFESEPAMTAFVNHVKIAYPSEKNLGGGYFGIPFIISVREKRVLSENAHFNATVLKFDLNQDQVISDAELRSAGLTVP